MNGFVFFEAFTTEESAPSTGTTTGETRFNLRTCVSGGKFVFRGVEFFNAAKHAFFRFSSFAFCVRNRAETNAFAFPRGNSHA